MIKTENGNTMMVGGLSEIMAETAVIPANVYVAVKDELGEAGAREMIVEIGRVAMADKMIAEIEKGRHHWKKERER